MAAIGALVVLMLVSAMNAKSLSAALVCALGVVTYAANDGTVAVLLFAYVVSVVLSTFRD